MESQKVEYKLVWNDNCLKVICGFANAKGGKLYVGFDDRGIVVGVGEKIRTLLVDLPNIIINNLGIIPAVEVVKREAKPAIRITVEQSSVPISYHGKYYIRSGSANFELKGSELSDFLLSKSDKTWDEVFVSDFTFKDIDIGTVREFIGYAKDRLPSIQNEKDHRAILRKQESWFARASF